MARLTIVESPYAGDIKRNLAYARSCISHCIQKGETPFASHLFFTQEGVLNDDDAEERKKGIELGFNFWEHAEKIVFYIDNGISRGMKAALENCIQHGVPYEFRNLPPESVGASNINPPPAAVTAPAEPTNKQEASFQELSDLLGRNVKKV